LAGTENIAITSNLAGTVNVLSLVATPSSTSGTTRGFFIQQANSANSNGLDTGILIDNADTDLAITTGIQFTNSGGGGFTTGIDMGNFIITNIGNAGTDFTSSGGLTLADALGITSGGITVTAGGATITAGALAVNSGSITSSASTLTIDAAGAVVLGGSGNTYTFSESTGPTYAGNARPTKRIMLTPEYAGASLTGSGSGTMTSDNQTSSPYRNYYNWTSTGTSQAYSIWVKVPLPADWDAWTSSSAFVIDAFSSSLANTVMTVTTYDTNNTVACNGVNIEPGSVDTWTDATPTNCTNTANTWAANGVMTVKIDLTSSSSANARVGRFYLEYRAKF
jgi:hypothetical protein